MMTVRTNNAGAVMAIVVMHPHQLTEVYYDTILFTQNCGPEIKLHCTA